MKFRNEMICTYLKLNKYHVLCLPAMIYFTKQHAESTIILYRIYMYRKVCIREIKENIDQHFRWTKFCVGDFLALISSIESRRLK